ncbi:MAG: glutamate synthase large subunit [Thermodesulfobacteriota bacterium]
MKEKRPRFGFPPPCGLYDPIHERDSCGVGLIVDVSGNKSHEIITSGIGILTNLIHRGALGGDMKTGDGAGILCQVPHQFLRDRSKKLGIGISEPGTYGVGMVFLPAEAAAAARCRVALEDSATGLGLGFLGWRDVPVNPDAVSGDAAASRPEVDQCFIGGKGLAPQALERRLYVVRRVAEKRVLQELGPESGFYMPSLSCFTIVYKGLLTGPQVSEFYPDLADPEFTSALAVVHQRYSTNTFPSWELAQPFRYLAHNGEINTLRGNLNHMRSRQTRLCSDLFGPDTEKLLPFINERGSDSSCLDNAFELLYLSGRSLTHTMLMLVPEAWGAKYPLGPDEKGFFEYHAGMMEPWDGPAAVAFTDGTRAGAILDRNGLRPARYTITRSGLMVLASEAGVKDFDPADIAEKGALRPGEIICADLTKKRILKNGEIKTFCSRQKPYRRWVTENKITLRGFYGEVSSVKPDKERLFFHQKLFGYTREDLNIILATMAVKGQEPVGSMGADTPLAVFSTKNQLLFNYFKQLFAQVTNPPIDPVREELVMSLMTFIGNRGNILSEVPDNARLIKLLHPVLTNEDLERLKTLHVKGYRSAVLPMGFDPGKGGAGLEEALEALCRRAEEALSRDVSILIVSDRDLPENLAPIPSLLAVSALNQCLVQKGLRTSAGILAETGEAREVMHMALLLGYGATAVNPYLAFETIADMALEDRLERKVQVAVALENYIKALCKGLLKIMSKMGISTLRSYRSAQVFEAVGISRDCVARYFPQTASRIGGVGIPDIAAAAAAWHRAALGKARVETDLLPSGGLYRYRKDGESHMWSPEAIKSLQEACRNGDYEKFRRFALLMDDQSKNPFTIRGLMALKGRKPVPLEQVEPESEIVKRFVVSAMSFGSISRAAHETIAIAANRLGARSNSGEGGEDPERYVPLANGDSRRSAVKQVASGRFGVTAHYLVNADELQIKVAQGAKPGEGGQLPGDKVNPEIAKVRHSTPGVTLISPPPHHDIYSIEDLAQLIFDLKNANPRALISVKLVSEVGVGTIAAGVAKAKADKILISGFDGGTGAAPLSSIRHAGAPWELGLAETHQTLMLNKLRDRVVLSVDGQMRTGRDVVIAALLGAEEYGFATAALVSLGCVMMRRCNENICPVGIATQNQELKNRFTGRPEHLVNYFLFMARQVREILAGLGLRSLEEAVGRADLLDAAALIAGWKDKGVNLSSILAAAGSGPSRSMQTQKHEIDSILDRELISLSAPALESGTKVETFHRIRNVNRTVGAMLSGEIARRHGARGLAPDTITCRFTGAAGQSFGAFCARGLTLVLTGEANDYLGKGLSGGRIIVKPYEGAAFDPSENVIAGNVLLYGATSGEVYLLGRAGERFAIRNSGAVAVVEGVGDHGCEYMTGGRVVILGDTGINFAAGMSGGIAYVYDPGRRLDERCNLEMVDLELISDPADERELRFFIENHHRATGSPRAGRILSDWDASLPLFVKVFPMEYRRVLGQMSLEDQATEREEVYHG